MITAAAATIAAAIAPIEMIATAFSNNPYFIGVMMLILNLGGRFIVLEVTKGQEKFFQNPWFRRFLIFTVLFVATRNLIVAAIMTVVIVLFIGYLFNENSRFYLFGSEGFVDDYPGSSQGGGGADKKDTLTVEEMEILNRLKGKEQKFAAAAATEKEHKGHEKDVPATRVYGANIGLIQGDAR